MGQTNGLDGERHLRLELLVAAQAAGLDRLVDRLLDLALRGHPNDLEELAHRHVEPVFVHGRALPFPPSVESCKSPPHRQHDPTAAKWAWFETGSHTKLGWRCRD